MQIFNQFDEGWKAGIANYFEEFVLLCWPAVYPEIDWTKGYTFLEQEFQSIEVDNLTGTRLADQLIKVWKNTGEEQWVLVHIEVQAQPVKNFAERMYVYRYRIFDRYRKMVASLGVLVDGQANWRPKIYEEMIWDNYLQYEYPIVKCLDYDSRRDELEHSRNPFAIILLAQLAVLKQSRGKPRLLTKLALTRKLYESGYTREEVIKIYYCLDALIKLPESLEISYHKQVQSLEEEYRMAYITTAERFGREEGRKLGHQEGHQEGHQAGIQEGQKIGEAEVIKLLLKQKFRNISEEYLSLVERADLNTLNRWAGRLLAASCIEDVFQD